MNFSDDYCMEEPEKSEDCIFPPEIEFHILFYIRPQDRAACRLTCKTWRKILLCMEYEFWIEFDNISQLVRSMHKSLFPKRVTCSVCPITRLNIKKQGASLIGFTPVCEKEDMIITLFDLDNVQYIVPPIEEKMYPIPWTFVERCVPQNGDTFVPRIRVYRRIDSKYHYLEAIISPDVTCSVRIVCNPGPVFIPSPYEYTETLLLKRLTIDDNWGSSLTLTVKPKGEIDLNLKISDGVTSYSTSYESTDLQPSYTEKQTYTLSKEFLGYILNHIHQTAELQLGGPYRSIFCVKCRGPDYAYYIMYHNERNS